MAKKSRRSIDQQIADLAAKIKALQVREAQKRAKADPALRFASAAFRSIEKAIATTSEASLRHRLLTVRSMLAAILGSPDQRADVDGRAKRVDADSLLTYVTNNPGQRGEEIASALATDSATIRPAMKRLIADGKVRTQGQKRAMRYEAV